MDKAALVGLLGVDIEGGARLLKALDKAGFDIHAALWIYLPDPEEWRLMIASPLVDQEGPKKAYILIQSELAKLTPPSEISLKNISAVGLEHRLIKALQGMVQVHRDFDSKGAWISNSSSYNIFIEAAYIYRMSKSRTE